MLDPKQVDKGPIHSAVDIGRWPKQGEHSVHMGVWPCVEVRGFME